MRTRVISAVIGTPLIIALILWPGSAQPFQGWPFALLVLALLIGALKEFFDGCRMAGRLPLDAFGYVAGLFFFTLALPLPPEIDRARLLSTGLTALVVLGFVWEMARPHHAPLQNLAPTWLGVLFVGWLLPFVLRLRLLSPDQTPASWDLPAAWMQGPGPGAWLVLFTMLVNASVDTGAYAFGKTLGRHKLAPTLSPGKTWEGAIGGFGTALLCAAGLGALLGLPLGFALACGAVLGVVAQLGDLSKSAVKREIGIKDFGTLIPGHGGVLDRFDSLLYSAPAIYWLATYWPQ